ncbi:hypothetical protein K8I28_16100, partial [bacterium]|nr:hypothetical protein [bacterium]
HILGAPGSWGYYASWTYFDYDEVDVTQLESFNTATLGLSKAIGPYRLYFQTDYQVMGDDRFLSHTVAVDIAVWNNVLFTLSRSGGKQRMKIDQLYLIVDTNRDLQTDSYKIAMNYKVSPNMYLLGSFVRTDYEPYPNVGNRWHYSLELFSFGIKIRY